MGGPVLVEEQRKWEGISLYAGGSNEMGEYVLMEEERKLESICNDGGGAYEMVDMCWLRKNKGNKGGEKDT